MLDPEFITLMLKLIPYVHQVGGQGLTMRKLSTIGGVDMVKLYEIMSTNLYKSPRSLVMLSRLQKAAELLRTTQRPVEQIAQECGFDTPNFLMGSFFHQYKLTPAEYREDQHSDSR
jgi:transcriptional regulator GlxA family with amidase domain